MKYRIRKHGKTYRAEVRRLFRWWKIWTGKKADCELAIEWHKFDRNRLTADRCQPSEQR